MGYGLHLLQSCSISPLLLGFTPSTSKTSNVSLNPGVKQNNLPSRNFFGWTKKFIFSWIWKLEVPDQGAGWFDSWGGLPLTCGWLPPRCVVTQCRELWALFLFTHGHQFHQIRIPLLWPHVTFITCLKVLSPNTATKAEGFGLHVWILRGHNSV